MRDLTDRIARLDEAAAVRLLTTVTNALKQHDESVFESEPTDDEPAR